MEYVNMTAAAARGKLKEIAADETLPPFVRITANIVQKTIFGGEMPSHLLKDLRAARGPRLSSMATEVVRPLCDWSLVNALERTAGIDRRSFDPIMQTRIHAIDLIAQSERVLAGTPAGEAILTFAMALAEDAPSAARRIEAVYAGSPDVDPEDERMIIAMLDEFGFRIG